jgi:hypothetical protein
MALIEVYVDVCRNFFIFLFFQFSFVEKLQIFTWKKRITLQTNWKFSQIN